MSIKETHNKIEKTEEVLPSLKDLEALTIVVEECAEVQHAISKAIRHGLDDYHPESKITNRENIAKEVMDLFCSIMLVIPLIEPIIESKYNNPEYLKGLVKRKNKYLHFNTLKESDVL